MNIDKMIAVSGVSGLYRLVTTKNNGLILADLDNGKTTFYSVRKHQFTPMQTVAIYTEEDTVEITKVFQSMLDHAEKYPVPDPNAAQNDLKKYFEVIIPNYDRDRVYHSDMKKVIKWFLFLHQRGLLNATEEESVNEEEAVVEAPVKAPAEKKTKKTK